MHPTNQLASTSQDTLWGIFTHLDTKGLGRAEQVCKYWQSIAGDNTVWRALFIRTFQPHTLPQNMTGKEAVYQYGAPAIETEEELFKKYLNFECNLHQNKKRAFICLSENMTIPVLFTVELGYGPQHGTEKGFSGSANETEICKVARKINIFSIFNIHQIEPSKVHHKEEFFESELNGINIYTRASINSCKIFNMHSEVSTTSPYYYDSASFFRLRNVFCEVVVEGVDVGWGNTLGYCSNINNWKKPFKFSCVDGKWSGRIPSFKCYSDTRRGNVQMPLLKFVKIGSNDTIVAWEACRENRNCDISNYRWKGLNKYIEDNDIKNPHYDSGVIQLCWNKYMKDFPIQFPT